MRITEFRRPDPTLVIGTSLNTLALGGVTATVLTGAIPSNTTATSGAILVATSSNTAEWRDALSFGSNTNDVSSVGTMGASPSNTRADHVHRGVHSIAHTSNTFYGDITLTASGTLGITSPAAGTFNLSATGVGGGGGGAPTDASYVTTLSDATLSAEIVHPEFQDGNSAGAAVDFTGAAVDTNVTQNAVTGMNVGRLNSLDNAYRYADVASAVGTGNFDYRVRVTDIAPSGAIHASVPLVLFGVWDTARTTGTMLGMQIVLSGAHATSFNQTRGKTGQVDTGTNHTGIRSPVILRVKRVGTTVNYYYSCNEGLSWTQVEQNTSSLNVGKVGFWLHANDASSDVDAIVHWVRSF